MIERLTKLPLAEQTNSSASTPWLQLKATAVRPMALIKPYTYQTTTISLKQPDKLTTNLPPDLSNSFSF